MANTPPVNSYSNISAAYKCYRYYKLKLIDKIELNLPRSSDLEFGTALHLALSASLSNEDAFTTFYTYWETIRNDNISYGYHNWEQFKELGEVFLARFDRLHKKKFEVKHKEERLYGLLGNTKTEGTPDFVGNFEGIPTVLDFKTSAKVYHKDKIEVNEQMYLYAHLAHQCLNFKAQQLVYFVFVKTPEPRIQVLVKKLDEEKMSSMLNNIELTIQDLTTRNTWPMNRESCIKGTYKCDFYEHCYGRK